jgi:hypothetical protein
MSMNRWVKDGKCPFCFGQGCDECSNTGTTVGLWEAHADLMAMRAEFARQQLESRGML